MAGTNAPWLRPAGRHMLD